MRYEIIERSCRVPGFRPSRFSNPYVRVAVMKTARKKGERIPAIRENSKDQIVWCSEKVPGDGKTKRSGLFAAREKAAEVIAECRKAARVNRQAAG